MYNKTTWVDGETPLSAENMNKIEDQLEINTDNMLPSKTGNLNKILKVGSTGAMWVDLKKVNGMSLFGSGDVYTDNYSTEEQVIGTWINNKPIYRKVFSFPLNGTYTESGKTFTWYSAGIPFEAISRCSGYVVVNGTKYPIDSINADLNVVIDNENRIQVGILSNLQNNQTIYVIVEYTKTTD